MIYEGNIFRPPSEANSLLIQTTIGCSHNRCTFCSMYKDKVFRKRSMEEIHNDLIWCSERYPFEERIFLCDGNALMLEYEELLQILKWINKLFKKIKRIGAYAAPHDILSKSKEQLASLYNEGLKIVYIGLESGADSVLTMIKKGVTAEEMKSCGKLISSTPIKSSVMVISGLGGVLLKDDHMIETPKILNLMQPNFLGFLSLMVESGTKLSKDIENGDFKLLSTQEILEETKGIISRLNLNDCFFSSAHASNYISLKGHLPNDKDRLLTELDFYLNNKETHKPEHLRRL